MHTVVKSISDLTDEEYRYCYNANLDAESHNGAGSMRWALRRYKFDKNLADREKARVVMLIDDRFVNARALVSWALVFNNDAYFWTKPHHRNKGYGTMVMKEVKCLVKRPVVYPWTNESGGFFSKFKVKAIGGDYFITDKPKIF